MTSLPTRLCALALLLGAVAGCALTSKSDPMMPRYFSPDESRGRSQVAAATSAPERDPGAPTIELRLGRVTAATYLGERIVFRDSNYELGFYEERRWTERPEAYLRRAVSRALFEDRGLRRVVSGAGPSLDIELSELAELRSPPIVRVRATYVLYDERVVRRQATLTIERPIPSAATASQGAETAARAMADAFGDAVNQIADRVTADLRRPGPIVPISTP
ncbi:MAG TPA: ABC-type transport auxiliary lipoprotein family protein [Polyangiaceae bacterium]|nr:ABC-type transport auxiliary lipoprotein family protein [Polyangiaceae bacterium]